MRRTRSFAVLLTGCLGLLLVVAGAATAGTPASQPVATASAGPAPILFGLGSPTPSARFATEAALGVRSAIVGSFATQTNSPDFWIHWADDVRAGGAVVQLFWDPTPGIANDPASTLRSIIRGDHDGYIKHWTRMVAQYGHPVIVRLMAEMNGNWQPYSPGINGNVASEFPTAWRHVVNLARSQEATNIVWDWNPNKPASWSTPLAQLWPGSGYVDWVGLDVYNWGDTAHGPWTPFATMMAPAVTAIRSVAGDKPLMINEVGTSTLGDKAGWLTEMFASLPRFGVKAVIYFDYDREGADWRLSSPPAAMAATKAAVRASPFLTGDQQAVEATESLITSPSRADAHTVADFDGNGSTDLAVYRPSVGGWYARGVLGARWGAPGDLPVPADYNGDHRTQAAVWRPGNGRWYIAGKASLAYGTAGDIPVPGDYTADGRTEVAVWRPSSGRWYVAGTASLAYGTAGDIPVPADYNGDGRTDLAVFRPATGTWWIRGAAPVRYGTAGDIPVPGDYNGDGRTDLAVFRPATGTWWIRGAEAVGYGRRGDIPVPGDYNADGRTELAVWRPASGMWMIRGRAQTAWGTASDKPLPLPQAIRGSSRP